MYAPRRRVKESSTGRVAALHAALLAALAVGCTSNTGATGSGTDAKAGPGTKSIAQPGKYRTLFEPCGSVGSSALKDLLPGTVGLPDKQQQEILRGSASSTFDTDRRVGCAWKSDAPDASHSLSLDIERVVSYDPAVSDDDRAQELFTEKQIAAAVPVATEAPTASASASAPVSGTPSIDATEPAATLGSRMLNSIGDAAYLDDDLASAAAGSTAQRRTVSVVFRTSNVIATVVYTEQSGHTTVIPESKELQEKAQHLARNLVKKFSD